MNENFTGLRFNYGSLFAFTFVFGRSFVRSFVRSLFSFVRFFVRYFVRSFVRSFVFFLFSSMWIKIVCATKVCITVVTNSLTFSGNL